MLRIQSLQCPECPAVMIRRPSGVILTSNPPQTGMEWHCYACGYTRESGGEPAGEVDDPWRDSWLAVNRVTSREREMQRIQDRVDEIVAAQPWWARWFVRAFVWARS